MGQSPKVEEHCSRPLFIRIPFGIPVGSFLDMGVNNNTQDPPPHDMQPCKVCQELIKPRAIKCIHCESYQDWSRNLLRGSAIAISLVAVITPLWGIAGSLIKMAFTDPTAQVEAALTSCGVEDIRVAYENSGKSSAIVTGVTFARIEEGKRIIPDDITVRGEQGDLDIVVSPNQPPVTVTYYAYSEQMKTKFIPSSELRSSCFYELEVRWMDFEGSQETILRRCSCPS